VCGHSNCGALRAVAAGSALDDTPNLKKWLDHARPALAMAQRQSRAKIDRPLEDRVSQSNVLLQLEHLSTYPVVRQGLAQKNIVPRRLVVRHRHRRDAHLRSCHAVV
jgi:carbonic anhydrase